MEATLRYWTRSGAEHNGTDEDIRELLDSIGQVIREQPTMCKLEISLEPADF